jgi:alanine racemase
MTHLARADDPRSAATGRQLARLGEATAGLAAELSIANSAGVPAWPETHGDWVRPGVMLYGVSPFPDRAGADEGLRAGMTLETRLIAVNPCPRACHQG